MSVFKRLRDLDGYLGVISLVMLIGTILLQIILRFVFLKPLMGAEELTRYLVICVVMFPLAYAERSGSSIIMEEIQSMFPRVIKNTINMASHILTTVVYAIVTVSAFSVLINNSANKTATLEMPVWLFFLPAVVGLSTMTVVRIITVVYKITKRGLPWESQ
jgi:TRAP-type C4-dicarboxylate transport system permease small subunit